jgi:glyoxylase-like metal-dependent hydrolase (beta-lactamase superfamily II)
MNPEIRTFFDHETFTASHVVIDPATQSCAIIDSVLDFDPAAGRTSTTNADAIIAFVETRSLSVQWILETHAHADHLSAAPYLKERLGGRIGIGEHIRDVQVVFGGSSTKAPRLLGTGPSLITSLSTARSSVSGSLKST